jgi:tetratricopeptide (TPR) repeat protein
MSERVDEDPEQALLVFATARPEWKPPGDLQSQTGYHQMELSALSESDTLSLVKELLQRAEIIPDEVVQLIVERSDGVPYFAEEIVNWFIDKGILDHHFEPWRFVPSLLDDSPLPKTLQHLLTTRLSSLLDVWTKALQYASVFGRTFWEGGLHSLGIRSNEELLEGLERRGYIEAQPVSSFLGEREWRFHHKLMRDVAYENILKKQRPALHKAAAAWIETQAERAGRLEEFAGVLGEHSERAGEPDEAADWYLRAGERAWSQGAVTESREFFDRTVELLPPDDRGRLWRVLLDRDEVFGLIGEVEKRRADEELLLELAMEFDEPARMAEAYYRRGVFFQSLGDYRMALTALEESAQSAKLAANKELEMKAVAWSVFCHSRLGELSKASGLADRALSAMDEIKDESTQARIMTNVAAFYNETGDLSKAASLFERQIEINDRLGDKAGEAIGLSNLGFIYMQLGMFGQAQSALQKALRINEVLGARRPVAYALLNLGLAHCRIGDHDRAREWIAHAQSELETLGDTFATAISHAYLGLCLEQRMNFSGAIESYRFALDIFMEAGLEGYVLDTTAGLARCKLELGSEDEATDHTNEVWEYLKEHGTKGLEFPILAYQTCVSVFNALGEGKKSKIALKEGWNELMSRADNISDASWRKSFLENVPEHRALSEMWDRRAAISSSG